MSDEYNLVSQTPKTLRMIHPLFNYNRSMYSLAINLNSDCWWNIFFYVIITIMLSFECNSKAYFPSNFFDEAKDIVNIYTQLSKKETIGIDFHCFLLCSWFDFTDLTTLFETPRLLFYSLPWKVSCHRAVKKGPSVNWNISAAF